ncbi:MAG: tRNA A-37 threonylcarbamoyl transferase component Bud32 [Pseudohongiellaceae bacterium]
MNSTSKAIALLHDLGINPSDWQQLKLNSRVYVAEHCSKPRILKIYIGATLKERLKALVGLTRSKRALSGTALLADIQVFTPQILSTGCGNGNAYIIMEKVAGTGAFDYLDSTPDLLKKDRKQLFESIGRLVAKLHNHGIVHGDIRPSNIFITDSNNYNKLALIDNDRTRKPLRKQREFKRNLVQAMMLPDNYISAAERDVFFSSYANDMGIAPQKQAKLQKVVMNKVYWRFEHGGLPHADHYKASQT